MSSRGPESRASYSQQRHDFGVEEIWFETEIKIQMQIEIWTLLMATTQFATGKGITMLTIKCSISIPYIFPFWTER